MEVARHWRNQESNYMGPSREAFDIKSKVRQEGEKTIVDYTVRTKLFNRKINFSVNGEGTGEAAAKMVEGLRGRGYNDETIFNVAFGMGDSDERLGMGFVEDVVTQMTEDKTPEAVEEKLVALAGVVL